MKEKTLRFACFRAVFPEIFLLLSAIAAFVLALALPLLSLAQALTPDEERLLTAFENGHIIRLHILADSDAPKDQRIKLQVRDAILQHFGGMLKKTGAESSEEVCSFISLHLEEMDDCAREAARKAGFSGEVKTEFGLIHLPEKTYGNVLLPEGEYMGLRITLGSGHGQNWWCVLYPDLCINLLCGDTLSEEKPEFHFDSLRIFQQWLLLSPL